MKKRDVDYWIKALRVPNPEVRMKAVMALGELGDVRAMRPLVQVLTDCTHYVRRVAAKALDQLGWTPSNETETIQYLIAKEAWTEVGKLGDPVIFPLLRVLQDGGLGSRSLIIETLAKFGESIIPFLLRILQDETADWSYRAEVARLLDRLNWQPKDKNEQYHYLVTKLRDDDWQIQTRAIPALGALGDARVVFPLLQMAAQLQGTKSGCEFKSYLPSAMEELGPLAIEPLLQALESEDNDIRMTAGWLLWEIIDTRAVEPLTQALRDKSRAVRKYAVQLLEKIGGTQAIASLLQALKDEYWAVRKEAAAALGEIGDARAVEPLTQALKDKSKRVQKAAKEALAILPKTTVASRVVDVLSNRDWLKLEASKTVGGQKLIVVTGKRKTREGDVIDMTPPCRISIERDFDAVIELIQTLDSGERKGRPLKTDGTIQLTSSSPVWGLYHKSSSGKFISREICLGKKRYVVDVRQIRALTRALRELRAILDPWRNIRPLTSFFKNDLITHLNHSKSASQGNTPLNSGLFLAIGNSTESHR